MTIILLSSGAVAYSREHSGFKASSRILCLVEQDSAFSSDFESMITSFPPFSFTATKI